MSAVQLHEQYRPSTWDELIGQRDVVKQVETLRRRGLAGRAYWISGISGSGKTTIAYLLAREIADKYAIMELDATDVTPNALKEIERQMHLYGLGKGGRAYIVNEAHGLRQDAIRQLLVLLERLPAHVIVVFTTTRDGQQKVLEAGIDGRPLLSRCTCFELNMRGLGPAFAERAQQIARAEGLDGAPLEAYLNLAARKENNLRAIFQAIEAGAMMRGAE